MVGGERDAEQMIYRCNDVDIELTIPVRISSSTPTTHPHTHHSPTMSASYPPSEHTLNANDKTTPKRPWRRYVTPWHNILDRDYPGKGTDDSPFLVDWLDQDEENPLRWGQGYKWFVTATVAISTLAVAMASSTL
jgi:hypothetical protein